jgi:hypothetical protein
LRRLPGDLAPLLSREPRGARVAAEAAAARRAARFTVGAIAAAADHGKSVSAILHDDLVALCAECPRHSKSLADPRDDICTVIGQHYRLSRVSLIDHGRLQ